MKHKSGSEKFFYLRQSGFVLFYDKITGKVVATWFPSSRTLKFSITNREAKLNSVQACLSFLEKV